MLEIPDDFEINRSVIKENSSFQELNTLLEETRNFMYEMSFLAYGRDSIVLHKVGVISGNQILDSVSRTAESIRYCCLNANFADAYSLLRKYSDDVFYYIYMLTVGDKTDFMKYVELKDLGKDERNIYDWIRNQQNDVYIGTIFKAIASSSAGEAIKKYKLKDAFDKLALKLNNFVHSNGQLYYNFSYQRMDTHSNISKYCKEFGEAITYITMSFLMVLVLIRPGLIVSEDYIDYLDCGDTPPDGSQYWVASFVSEYVSTDKNGHAESKELPICTYNEDGSFKEDIHYTVVETKAADGYILDETAHDVTLRYDDNAPDVVVTTLKLINVPTEPKLPQTGDNANPLLYLGIGALALITGVGVGLRGRKKKNKQ